MCGFTEKSNFQGGLKNPIYRGELPKKGELGRFADLKGGLAKKQKGGWSFFCGGGAWYANAHYDETNTCFDIVS